MNKYKREILISILSFEMLLYFLPEKGKIAKIFK